MVIITILTEKKYIFISIVSFLIYHNELYENHIIKYIVKWEDIDERF